MEESTLPEKYQKEVKKLHEGLIEYVAESDDELLEKFFEKGGLSEEEMRKEFIKLFKTKPLFHCSVYLRLQI